MEYRDHLKIKSYLKNQVNGRYSSLERSESDMISLIQYDEFGRDMGFPSIKDSFQKERYEGQEKIVE